MQSKLPVFLVLLNRNRNVEIAKNVHSLSAIIRNSIQSITLSLKYSFVLLQCIFNWKPFLYHQVLFKQLTRVFLQSHLKGVPKILCPVCVAAVEEL